MIFTLLWGGFTYLVVLVLGILPNGGTLPQGYTDGVLSLWNTLRAFDFILPLDTLRTCLTIAFLWTLFVLVWDLIHWVLKKVPFVHMT